ncbi:hypothetical protein [Pimelobacter simplex]|uniref:hypothetical protein n=1 Tax=Nocardioides simplex TaxID=2045 RepID=UPI003AAAC6FA
MGGFLVARDDGLYTRTRSVLLDLGAEIYGDAHGAMVQLTDPEGRLFTAFERAPAGTEGEFNVGPFWAAPGVTLPEMSKVVACPFECRWVDLVVRIADLVARSSERPTWLLDGDGVVWDAEHVDPGAVSL